MGKRIVGWKVGLRVDGVFVRDAVSPFQKLLRFGSFLPSELTNQAVSLSYGLRPLAKTTPIVMKQS